MLPALPKLYLGSVHVEIKSETQISVNGETISIQEDTRLTDFVRDADEDGKADLSRITNHLLHTGINAVMTWVKRTPTSSGGWAVFRNGLIQTEEQ